MRKKVILTIIIQLFIVACLSAQTIKVGNSEDYSSIFVEEPTTFLDKSTILVTYRLEILHDTVNLNATKSNNIMMLEIGAKYDKYFDLLKARYKAFLCSEENKTKDPNTVINEAMQMGKGTLNEEIYWNYPNKNELTTVNHMLGSFSLYQEPIPQIKWEMKTDIEIVANYMCNKAICNLFGRRYIVWYTPEIPVAKGPWKFSGLPGLILRVIDERDQISWTCIELEMKEKDIFFTERDYIKTDKPTFLKAFNDYKRNPTTAMQSSGMVSGDLPERAKKKRHYNPIELSE